MNIFVTSSCPRQSARVLDDKRVVKMVLESAQMLSTAMTLYGLNETAPYRPTHMNHPCMKWVMDSRSNLKWLFEHYTELSREYTRRYGKRHKCRNYEEMFYYFVESVALTKTGYELEPPKEFCNCTPYKDMDVFMAYQLYLNDKWDSDKREPTWYGVKK